MYILLLLSNQPKSSREPLLWIVHPFLNSKSFSLKIIMKIRLFKVDLYFIVDRWAPKNSSSKYPTTLDTPTSMTPSNLSQASKQALPSKIAINIFETPSVISCWPLLPSKPNDVHLFPQSGEPSPVFQTQRTIWCGILPVKESPRHLSEPGSFGIGTPQMISH